MDFGIGDDEETIMRYRDKIFSTPHCHCSHVGDYFPFPGWVDELSGLCAHTRRLARRWDGLMDELIEGYASSPSFLDVPLSLQKDGLSDINPTRHLIKVLLHELISGGTDTSRVALDWGMAELVRSPEAMDKLKAEVREAA